MAKRDTTTQTGEDMKTKSAMERRVVAFAEQLGRMVGTVEAKAEGWMDGDALNTQIASVRDAAATLLTHLSSKQGTEKRPAKPAPPNAARPTSPTSDKRRSGGMVDAPGKKHRQPAPATPAAKLASQTAGPRTPKTMRPAARRGRG
ncbi:MAG: hypothetical protein ABI051_13730 [Vicinamibacterales bacterium]